MNKETKKRRKEMKYYPISIWKNTNGIVRFAFTHNSFQAAVTAAKTDQEKYKDQIFTGQVIRCNNSNDGFTKAQKIYTSIWRLECLDG